MMPCQDSQGITAFLLALSGMPRGTRSVARSSWAFCTSTTCVTPGFYHLHNPTACYHQQRRREWTVRADRRRKGNRRQLHAGHGTVVEGRGVSGLRSGVDVISDARAAAAQHKQWRAQQTGGGIASRQQLHARTNGGNGRARIHSSCSSGGGGGSYSCHRPPHHWRRGAARSASRLTPADWAHAPRGAAGDLICSNPP